MPFAPLSFDLWSSISVYSALCGSLNLTTDDSMLLSWWLFTLIHIYSPHSLLLVFMFISLNYLVNLESNMKEGGGIVIWSVLCTGCKVPSIELEYIVAWHQDSVAYLLPLVYVLTFITMYLVLFNLTAASCIMYHHIMLFFYMLFPLLNCHPYQIVFYLTYRIPLFKHISQKYFYFSKNSFK